MPKQLGRSSWMLQSYPSIRSWTAVVGKKEGEGPLAEYFEFICEDTTMGEDTWEQAESGLQKSAVDEVLKKAELSPEDINLIFAGDLLNQCISTHYGLRDFNIPFYGLYGACSTMAESLSFAAVYVENQMADHVIAVTSSHFCSAERQFRMPLEYGGQRPPTSQWTATGAGAVLLGSSDQPPYVKAVCAGKITDLGIKDISNMGAAMAPAAADTIKTYFEDSKTGPSDYDLIVTGDLGRIGSQLLQELLMEEGIDISAVHNDCGMMLYDCEAQDVHAGGSGAGCSASVLCSVLLERVQSGQYRNLLFIATGALMSTTSFQQGESIPTIAHLVHITSQKGDA